MIFEIPIDAPWYHGSGQSIAAIIDGKVIDAIYSGINVEQQHRAEMTVRHPTAKIVAGIMSDYQLTLFDPSELNG